jgi:acetolactate synthase-1/2/3 large subunit
MSQKASDLFIQCLEQEGVEYIFGVPGEENLDFLDSLSRSKKIRLILTRHEQGAGFMAATYGRHTGKAGRLPCHAWAGATNFVTAAAYAQLGGMPMMMITGQKPIKKSKQGRFQILDVVAMMGRSPNIRTRWRLQTISRAAVREAFRLAEEEKPGAVHIELPEDIADEHTDSPFQSSAASPGGQVRTRRRLQLRLQATGGGQGANPCDRRWRQPHHDQARCCAKSSRKTNIPFLTTQLGKGVIDERHPRLGCAALSAGDFVHRAVEASDCIVNVGHDVIEKPPFFMRPGGARR